MGNTRVLAVSSDPRRRLRISVQPDCDWRDARAVRAVVARRCAGCPRRLQGASRCADQRVERVDRGAVPVARRTLRDGPPRGDPQRVRNRCKVSGRLRKKSKKDTRNTDRQVAPCLYIEKSNGLVLWFQLPKRGECDASGIVERDRCRFAG